MPIRVVSQDTQAPTQPGGFAVTAPGTGGLRLDWTASTDGPAGSAGGSGLRGYRVFRANTPAGPFSQIALVEVDQPRTYSDLSVSQGVSRSYYIDAIDNAGNVSTPTTVQSATAADTTAPTAPVISATPLSASSIEVAIVTPATDTGSGVAGYDLEYKRAVDTNWSVSGTNLPIGDYPRAVSLLPASTLHDFRSRARDQVGNIGPYSAVVQATTLASGGGSDPYPWYPALDLNTIPFHQAAGVWGPRQIIQAPAAPVITAGSVNVSTPAALIAAAATPGRVINVTASMGDVFMIQIGTIRDLDIVLQAGVHIGNLYIGSTFFGDTVQRVRVRAADGVSATNCSVNYITGGGTVMEDLIFSGIGIRGRGTAGIYLIGVNRMCFVNCVGRSDQEFALIGPTHCVIAGCNFASGFERDQFGDSVRWGLRAGGAEGGTGPYVIVNTRSESLSVVGDRSYHRIRFHPRVGGGQSYFYAANNTLVDSSEARGLWVEVIGANGASDTITAAWAINSNAYLRFRNVNPFYSESYVLRAVQNYARATGVNFYGDITLGVQQGANAASAAADKDHTTGCTFNPWQEPPAWGFPGSPLLLPT